MTASALLLGGTMAWGVENSGNPYADIVTRNAFSLKPPEPPKELPPPVEEKAPSNIIMTGVTSIGGKKQVYLKLTTPGEKEPEYLRLGENERQGAIEVVEIIPKTGRVRIKNRGVPSLISFETHGAMAAAAPAAPAGMPGRPGMPALPSVPGVAPVSANNSVSAKPITTSSTLPVSPNNTGIRPTSRPPTGGSGVSPTGNVPTPTRSIPTRPLRVSPGGGGASYQAPPAPEVNPAVQAVQIEVNRVAQPSDFPPLPPTPLSQKN
jgi:hypothetical protein